MNQRNVTRWLMPALLATTVLASPLALANHHGEGHRGDRPHGKPPAEACDRLRAGEAPFDDDRREAFRERMDQRHDEIAQRLQLTAEQREIWDDLRDEQRAKWQERMAERHERMLERCEEADED